MVDAIFLGCAVVGGGVFAIRTMLQLLGVGHGHDLNTADTSDGDADHGFRVLSLQGLSAFFMMFGLVGLALVRQSGAAPSVALIAASAAGVATVWLIGRMFGAMRGLQSTGNINLWSAVGQEGQVYLTVQRGGEGKVQLVVQNRLGVYDARSEDGAELATGRRVRVVGVNGEVLVVEPIDAKNWIEANLPPADKESKT